MRKHLRCCYNVIHSKKIFMICMNYGLLLFIFMLKNFYKWEKNVTSKVYVELYKTCFSDARMPYYLKPDFVKKKSHKIKMKLLKIHMYTKVKDKNCITINQISNFWRTFKKTFFCIIRLYTMYVFTLLLCNFHTCASTSRSALSCYLATGSPPLMRFTLHEF